MLFASLVGVSSAVYAQASITGVVRDTAGAVLPGVTVEAASPALIEKVRSAVSDGTGQYRIENLRPGTYTVTFTLSGFTGLSEHHKDVVRRFAHAGYYAVAPELFHREGGMQGKPQPELSRISASIGREQYLGDIRAAADHAKQQSVRADRLGELGLEAFEGRSADSASLPRMRHTMRSTIGFHLSAVCICGFGRWWHCTQ